METLVSRCCNFFLPYSFSLRNAHKQCIGVFLSFYPTFVYSSFRANSCIFHNAASSIRTTSLCRRAFIRVSVRLRLGSLSRRLVVAGLQRITPRRLVEHAMPGTVKPDVLGNLLLLGLDGDHGAMIKVVPCCGDGECLDLGGVIGGPLR